MVLRSVIRNFVRLESSSGILLLIAGLIALVLSNSSFAGVFDHILHLKLYFGTNLPLFYKSIQHWINDGLMVIFFFVVGLELKREFLEGELSMPSQAILPVIAAVGGMAVPAIFYLLFNFNNPETFQGWAIPSATDIAFSLGVLSLLGKKVPISLKIFLMALAIIDDLGAIIIIALFYSSNLEIFSLLVVLFILFFLYLCNRRNLQNIWIYILLGFFLWIFIQNAGIHATISGVLLAIFVPHKKTKQGSLLTCAENKLHPWVAYLIMPLFALTNAGVYLGDVSLASLSNPVPLGIMTGLFFGKQIGVFFTTFLLIKMGYARLPSGSNWIQMYGIAMLSGIGFTMAMFINFLAFDTDIYINQAKIAILIASFTSAVLGYILLNFKSSRN
jgi:NhaA family Na+:H+ antiporter|tara:strand:+ start:209 stop:1372 length:1164 start_codon:yes stop_codon:yes gene_type:complete